MPVPLIPIVIAGANVVARVAPLVARRLIARGVAKKATEILKSDADDTWRYR